MEQTKAQLKAQGKANRAKGARFELKVRKHLELLGWHVTKYRNNIDLEAGEVIPAKTHFFPGRGTSLGSGFPDFVCFKYDPIYDGVAKFYKVQFVEAKLNGLLDKEEKLKLKFLQEKGYETYVAYEDKSQSNNIRLRKFIYSEEKEKIPRGKTEEDDVRHHETVAYIR